MKIGIIGVPGSGKTEFANGVMAALDAPGYLLLDDYVGELSERLDFEYGQFATYIGNLSIAMTRLGCEREHELTYRDIHDMHGDPPFMVCGTLVDTLAYTIWESVNSDKTTQADHHRAMSVISLIGCLYKDTFDYDLVFKLPCPQDAEKWIKEVDDCINEIIVQFQTDAIPLLDDRNAQLVTVLNRIHELESETTN
jgi:hypothetical protein